MICTVIIPNYRTPLLTKLCLRTLRYFSDLDRLRVIVVDNGSADESLEYLRHLEWITLMERDPAGESGPVMHARALDMAMTAVDTPFVAVMHTDTIVKNPLWLDFLLHKFDDAPKLAGVGSWKLETISLRKFLGQKMEDIWRFCKKHRRRTHEERYLRSHCAIYRTELLRKFTRGFFDGETAGKSIHRMLVENGFEMRFLESQELGKFVMHLNHATMILNPSGSGQNSLPETRQKLDEKLDQPFFREILNNSELDRP